MINFSYVRPTTQKAAIDAARDPKAQYIGGGTNLVDLMKKGVMQPEKLVDVHRLPSNTIEQKGAVIRIGAMALNSAVADHELIVKKLPLLSKALQAGATQQIRNMATVGGNLMQRTRCLYFYNTDLPCNKRQPGSGCGALKGYNRMHAIFGASDQCIAVHPSDMCVAMAALDAEVIVEGAAGARRIPFTSFHRLPGTTPQVDNNLKKSELITAIEIPDRFANARAQYTKVRDRTSYAFALVSLAASAQFTGDVTSPRMSGVRLALGGVAHKPWRLTAVERFLETVPATDEMFRQAGVLAVQGAKGYGYNNFKLKMVPAVLMQTLKELRDANKENG